MSGLIDAWKSISYEEFAMQTLLIYVIVLLSAAICAVAGIWFYGATRGRKQDSAPPQIAHRSIRNEAWDRAVHAARKRNR